LLLAADSEMKLAKLTDIHV